MTIVIIEQRARVNPVAVVAVFLLCCILVAGPAAALKNPSTVYCEAMGYQYISETAPDGGAIGKCKISDTETIDAWKFLQGYASQDKSYCAKQGLKYQQVTDPATCRAFGLDTCMVCVLPDGKTVEVTKYMNLSFAEGGICGDGICAMSEVQTCPKDCPAAQYAPPASGGNQQQGTAQQGAPLPSWLIPAVVVLVIVVIAGLFLLMRKKEKSP